MSKKNHPSGIYKRYICQGRKVKNMTLEKKKHFFEEIKSMGRDNYAQTSVTMFCPKNHILI